jgi:hypothetical protein
MLDTPLAKLQKRNAGEATEVLEAVGWRSSQLQGRLADGALAISGEADVRGKVAVDC